MPKTSYIKALVIAATLAAPGIATAQSSPILLTCAWTNGPPSVWKFADGRLMEWNAASWAWADRRCSLVFQYLEVQKAPVCVVTVTSGELRWAKEWFLVEGTHHSTQESEAIVISRITGDAVYTGYANQNDLYKGTAETPLNTSAQAKCQKMDDPVLQPKPEPKF